MAHLFSLNEVFHHERYQREIPDAGHGKEYTSMEFSKYIEKKMLTVPKRLVFIIGGPYGFSDDVKQRASEKISLSKMTFSHEMIRMIFTEQLYRAMTIMRNEPYHHE